MARKLTEEQLKSVTGGAQGTVKLFNAEKGFGFIEPEDGGKDVFVYTQNVKDSEKRSTTGEITRKSLTLSWGPDEDNP